MIDILVLFGKSKFNVRSNCRVFEGHADAVTSLAFTQDSLYIVTACSEGTWRIFDVSSEMKNALVVCEAHDLGVQGCDFSPVSSPFPGTSNSSRQSFSCDTSKYYILATCGNDSLVKLWRINVICDKIVDDIDYQDLEEGSNSNPVSFSKKRILAGHGGNVMNVKFAPVNGEILGSVATDRTARIWSAVSSAIITFVIGNTEFHTIFSLH